MNLLIYSLNELKSITVTSKSKAEIQKSLSTLLDQTKEKERNEKLENEKSVRHLISDMKDLIADTEAFSFQELTGVIDGLVRQYKKDITVNLGYLTAKEINDLMEDQQPPSTQMRTREEVLKCAPEYCLECNGEVKFWGETEEEIIFQCVKCTKHYTIPYDPKSETIYFS